MPVSTPKTPAAHAWPVFCAALAAILLASRAPAADPVADLEAQYQSALAALNKPPTTGILVTEVQPESAAAAGLRAGDILTEYNGTRVTTLQALTDLVSQTVAHRIQEDTAGKPIPVRVRRGGQDISLQFHREALGIRAIEVQAGVPGPRNPPPNPRGTLDLDWKTLVQTLRADGPSGPAAFRLFDRTNPAPDATQPTAPPSPQEDWIGWELCALTPEGDNALAGAIDIHHLLPTSTEPEDVTQAPTEHSAFTFHLQLGDFKTTPACVLDEATARYTAPTGQENTKIVASAKRLGETLQTTLALAIGDNAPASGVGEHHENAAPLNALPQAALPWIAAAMAHREGDALALNLLSIRDFLPRPGYVLATRGKLPLPTEPGPDAGTAPVAGWRVDLMHCGVIIESYWFTDQRRVLCVQTQGPASLIARRAESAQMAATPLERTRAHP